jgi:hypothetical protein
LVEAQVRRFEVAFQQRQKKRRAKAAQAGSRAAQRSSGSKSSLWWLTIVKRDTCCARCAGMLRVGRPMVYCASPREALCEPCAESRGIYARPSTAWEKQRAARRRS